MHVCVLKALGMSSRVCAAGHRPIKDPVALVEKSRASHVAVVGFLLFSFIKQSSLITGLNKLYDYMFLP